MMLKDIENFPGYLAIMACLAGGMLIGIGVGQHSSSIREDDPSHYAAVLLKKELFKQGFLAEVKCPVWSSSLEPLCEVMMQPKSGGPMTGPFRYSGRNTIEWKAY